MYFIDKPYIYKISDFRKSHDCVSTKRATVFGGAVSNKYNINLLEAVDINLAMLNSTPCVLFHYWFLV